MGTLGGETLKRQPNSPVPQIRPAVGPNVAVALPSKQSPNAVTLTVPKGYKPGRHMIVKSGMKQVEVTIPEGAYPGMTFTANIGGAPSKV